MSEVEKYQSPIAELELWATRLYESGMFRDVKDAAEAFVKITAGAEMGLSPSQSMRGVHVIAGKTIIGAGLLSSLLDRPPYDFKTEYEPDIKNPTSCTITVFKHGVERGQSYFSLDDARRAGLLKSGGNWEKYPSDMLFARAVSQAARRYAAGALGGAVYVEAHGEFEIQSDVPVAPPSGVKAKPRTRVTAEVVQDAEVEMPYEPVTPPPLSVQLKTLSLQDRADLYELVGIAKGTPLGKVRHTLMTASDEFGLEEEGEPNAAAILAVARQVKRDALPDDAVDAFEHFAVTGQDLDADPQTALT